jgi:hypothetical protein
LTNYSKWCSYTDGLPSPQQYIDWGWLYCVGAALERRVYLSPSHAPIFANKYIIFVGEAGVGKGNVIRYVTNLLMEHKKEAFKRDVSKLNPEQQKIFQEMERRQLAAAQADHDNITSKNAPIDKALLFPRAADSTTYQSLIQCLVHSLRRYTIVVPGEDGKPTTEATTSCAMYATLEELASMFRKNTQDIVNLLLACWDCLDVYEYITIGRGKDRIMKVCFNILAGTTPNFLSSVFDSSLIDEGFSRRALFIYAAKNRKVVFTIPQLTDQQKKDRADISQHIKKLASLQGEVRTDADTESKLLSIFEKITNDKSSRASTSKSLAPYYASWNVHIKKGAMAEHFGESEEMFIPFSAFEQTIERHREMETKAHMALMLNHDNPESKTAMLILRYLTVNGEKTFNNILAELYHAAKAGKKEIENALMFLDETNQITNEKKDCPISGESLMFYRMK